MRRLVHISFIGVLAVPLFGGRLSAQTTAQDSAWLAARGFYQRKPDALLHIGGTQIPQPHASLLTRVLRSVPRIEIKRYATGGIKLLLHEWPDWKPGESPPPCELTVYFNGAHMRLDPKLNVDEVIHVEDLTGLELYEATRSPVGDLDECGTLLIWNSKLTQKGNYEFRGTLSGNTLDASGDRPVDGVTITLDPGGLQARTDRNGRFEFRDIPGGIYQLIATLPNDSTRRVLDVRVPAYKLTEITIEIRQH